MLTAAVNKARQMLADSPPTRSARVIAAVLNATVDELASVGYGSLSIEEVAKRAGVNKTTVYRRWPNKEALVRAALLSRAQDKLHPPDTGSLRGDLLKMLQQDAKMAASPLGQCMMRTILAEGPRSEIVAIARSLRAEHEHLPMRVIERAIERGELPPGVPGRLIFELLFGALHHGLFIQPAGLDDAHLHAFIDLVLDGARHYRVPARNRSKPPKPSPASGTARRTRG